jgi:hypothetical protein
MPSDQPDHASDNSRRTLLIGGASLTAGLGIAFAATDLSAQPARAVANPAATRSTTMNTNATRGGFTDDLNPFGKPTLLWHGGDD